MTRIKLILSISIILVSGNLYAQNVDLMTLPAITWDAPTGGGYFRISQMSACNSGSETVTSDFDVSLILKNEDTEEIYFIATQTVSSPNLTQGTCQFVYNLQGYLNDAPVTVPSGIYQWGVWVDSGEEFTEADEENNFRFIGTYNNNSPLSVESSQIPQSFSISPNPANDIVKIESLTNNFTSLQIIDLNGKVVLTNTSSVSFINISELQNGSYFIRLISEDGIYSKKLIIQH